MRTKKSFHLKKNNAEIGELQDMTPAALTLLGAVTLYGAQNDIKITITCITKDVKCRTTNSHKEGRAFDIRSKHIKYWKIKKMVREINKKYADSIGAFSLRDGKARAAVYHGGTAMHFHFQARPAHLIKKSFWEDNNKLGAKK